MTDIAGLRRVIARWERKARELEKSGEDGSPWRRSAKKLKRYVAAVPNSQPTGL